LCKLLVQDGNILSCPHRRWANFSRGLSHLCPKNFSDCARKTATLTCKLTLPDLPQPVIISKNCYFEHFISLDRMNSVFLLNTHKNIFFIFGCWHVPKKFSFCPKNNGFARVWGAADPSPLARTPIGPMRVPVNIDFPSEEHRRIFALSSHCLFFSLSLLSTLSQTNKLLFLFFSSFFLSFFSCFFQFTILICILACHTKLPSQVSVRPLVFILVFITLSLPVFFLSLAFIFSLHLSQSHPSFSSWLFLSLPIIYFVFLPFFNCPLFPIFSLAPCTRLN